MFKKASLRNIKIRMAMSGVSGSGKTYTALAIAEHLGKTVAVIDTERNSSSRYANIFNFDVCDLENHDIGSYIEAIRAANEAKYNVIVIDSLSHSWLWETAQVAQEYNSFKAWGKMRPLERQLIDAIMNSSAHIIATLREKTTYEVEENEKGKKEPRKIGTAPVQSTNLEYEFDIYGTIDSYHNLKIVKSRCPQLQDREFLKAGKDVAWILNEWIEQPWKNWRSEQDAIKYAAIRYPNLSESEIVQRYQQIPSVNGRKAVEWVKEVGSWSNNNNSNLLTEEPTSDEEDF